MLTYLEAKQKFISDGMEDLIKGYDDKLELLNDLVESLEKENNRLRESVVQYKERNKYWYEKYEGLLRNEPH